MILLQIVTLYLQGQVHTKSTIMFCALSLNILSTFFKKNKSLWGFVADNLTGKSQVHCCAMLYAIKNR